MTLNYKPKRVTTCFSVLGLSRMGFEHPTFRLRGERSNPLRHRRGEKIKYISGKFKWYCLPKANKKNYISFLSYYVNIL